MTTKMIELIEVKMKVNLETFSSERSVCRSPGIVSYIGSFMGKIWVPS